MCMACSTRTRIRRKYVWSWWEQPGQRWYLTLEYNMADHTNCRTVDLVIRKFDSMYVYKLRIFALPWLFPAWAVGASFAEISDVLLFWHAAGHTHQAPDSGFYYLWCCTHVVFKRQILVLPLLLPSWIMTTEISDVFLFWCCSRPWWMGKVSCDELIGLAESVVTNWLVNPICNALLGTVGIFSMSECTAE